MSCELHSKRPFKWHNTDKHRVCIYWFKKMAFALGRKGPIKIMYIAIKIKNFIF